MYPISANSIVKPKATAEFFTAGLKPAFLLAVIGTIKQVAEKVRMAGEDEENHPSAAKADGNLAGLSGTTESRALSKPQLSSSFSATCKAVPFQGVRILARAGCLWTIVLLLGGSIAAPALEPTTPLAGYGRQAWVMENGLPQNTVQALVQTRDGFVWLGTEVGLVRFDGIGFEVFDKTSKPALPGNDVQCLLAASDGSLWIGTSEGLAHWDNGAMKVFSTKEGLPGNDIRAMVQGANGVVFAWSAQGLARYEDDHFVETTDATHFAPGAISAVTSNGQDEIWVTAGEDMSIYRQGRWEQAHMAPPIAGGGVQFVQAFENTSAVASKNTLLVLRGGSLAARLAVGSDLPGNRIQALLADHEGTLWIGTNGGLARWVNGQAGPPSGHRSAGLRLRSHPDGRPRGQSLGGHRDRRPAHPARSAFQSIDSA